MTFGSETPTRGCRAIVSGLYEEILMCGWEKRRLMIHGSRDLILMTPGVTELDGYVRLDPRLLKVVIGSSNSKGVAIALKEFTMN